MELKEFVTQSIVHIMEGVKDAQVGVRRLNAIVNPYTREGYNVITGKSHEIESPSKIEFEVSVTNSKEKGTKGELEVLFGALSISGGGGANSSKMGLNKLKFDVPVIYPMNVPE